MLVCYFCMLLFSSSVILLCSYLLYVLMEQRVWGVLNIANNNWDLIMNNIWYAHDSIEELHHFFPHWKLSSSLVTSFSSNRNCANMLSSFLMNCVFFFLSPLFFVLSTLHDVIGLLRNDLLFEISIFARTLLFEMMMINLVALCCVSRFSWSSSFSWGNRFNYAQDLISSVPRNTVTNDWILWKRLWSGTTWAYKL